MKDIINLTIKNFKLAFRSKSSIFTLLFAPLIIIFLLGTAFNNTGTYNINIGIYSEQYTVLADSLIESLNEESFRILKINSEEFCVNQVKEGIINLCMIFPKDFEIAEGKTNEIVFHVDPSNINIVSEVVNLISSKLSVQSESISLNLTTNLLDRIDITSNELSAHKEDVEILKKNIDKLTLHNNEIGKSVLSSLDLSNFKISDVSATSGEVNAKISNLVLFMNDKIDTLRDAIDTVDDEAGSLSVEDNGGTKDALDEAVVSLTEDVDSIEEEMNSTYVDTKAKFEQMNSMVDNMEGKVNDIISSLNKIKSEKEASEKLLIDSTQKISAVDNSYNKMILALTTIDVAEAGNIVNPFITTIKPVVEKKSHLNYVYAGIVMLIIMFVSILLSSTLVMSEKKSKSYLLNYLSPAKDISFVISMYLTIMVLMILQATIIMGISSYFFPEQITANLLQISLILLASISLFVLLGMLIAYFFKAEQTITLMSITFGSLFMLLSNLVLPLEAMPRSFLAFVNFNPFLISQNMLKKVFMFSAPLSSISRDLVILACISAGLFIMILMNEGMLKRKGMLKFFKLIFGKKN